MGCGFCAGKSCDRIHERVDGSWRDGNVIQTTHLYLNQSSPFCDDLIFFSQR